MTAACQMCGLLITAKASARPIGRDADEADLQDFDLLAGAVLFHIGQYHMKEAGAGLMAIANLASKVYAMTLAESSAPNFRILDPGLHAGAPALESPAGAGASSTESESNEKKSERNSST